MEDVSSLRKAVEALQPLITEGPTEARLAARLQLRSIALCALTLCEMAAKRAEQLEEEILSLGVLLPAEANPLPQILSALLADSREEYRKILLMRRRVDTHSSMG